MDHWVEEVFSDNLPLGLDYGDDSAQFEPAWHRSIFRALAENSLLLIGSASMPTYLLKFMGVELERQRALVQVRSKESTNVIEVSGEELEIDPETKIRLGFVGSTSKSVEIDITTSNWLYRADEWLSRLITSSKMTAHSVTDFSRVDSANLL